MRTIAILDSGFQDSNPKIRSMWKGFNYEKIDLVGSGDYHSHGTLVANLAMRPFDTDQLRNSVKFYHIRCADSDGNIALKRAYQAFDLLWDLNCTSANMSWGFPQPVTEQMLIMAEKLLSICDGGVAMHFAAGNEDTQDLDNDLCLPQGLLRQGKGTFLWGALNKDGTAPEWSSDGENLFGCMWGAERPVHGTDGHIASVDGTSFASPAACGMCEALMAMGTVNSFYDLEEYLLQSAIHLTCKEDGSYVPYVDSTGNRWHPKFGFGSLEHLYQGLTAESRCRPQRVPAAAIRWHNFRRVE